MTGEEYIEHKGILGMHWRKHKAKSSAPPKASSHDHSAKEVISKKKLHELSNADIKTLTDRLQLEKQYRELTKVNMSPGRKFVTELVTNAAKEIASTFVKKQIAKLAEGRLR